jgi:hypothetical protein
MLAPYENAHYNLKLPLVEQFSVFSAHLLPLAITVLVVLVQHQYIKNLSLGIEHISMLYNSRPNSEIPTPSINPTPYRANGVRHGGGRKEKL